jgi:hypothetical protein
MTNARQRLAFLGGLTGAVLFALWRVYSRRSRERVVSHEGLDDPEVAQAFGRIATLPQMRLLRWFVARRAVAMVQAGQAADLGCGSGHLAIRLAQAAPGLQVTGIDPSDEMLLLLLITLVYTLILAIFIAQDYPAAAPSVLPLRVEEQYPVQILYQGPLFFASTALAAGVLVLAGHLLGGSPAFRLAFGRIAYASVIPFFFTTMLIELALVLAPLAGIAQPDAVLNWLGGLGALAVYALPVALFIR